jgi:SAM-dependent methyltransferase
MTKDLNKEDFKPIKNEPPSTLKGKIKFYGRMILDFQILTIYSDLKKELPKLKGVILDIGCGQSPYRFLLNSPETIYKGIDVKEASEFDYQNSDILQFDGVTIPFESNSVDGVICTEVLEHVFNYELLVSEIHRICKPGAKIILTIPFSARYHYIPHDYFRYTPSALETIFKSFSKVEIVPRGTDILSICSKIIVLFFRNFSVDCFKKIICFPIWICLTPFLALTILIAHISRIFNWGSVLDPLGYTIKISK